MDARRALAALSIAWAVRAGRAIPVRWSVRPHRPAHPDSALPLVRKSQHVGAPQRGYPVVHQSRVQPPQHVRLPKHHIDGSPLAPSAAPAIPARSYTPVSRTETMFVSAHLKIQTLDVSSSDTKTGTSGCT